MKYYIVWWIIAGKFWRVFKGGPFDINEAHSRFMSSKDHMENGRYAYDFLIVEENTDLTTLPPPARRT
jgi:hypothetical protein